MWHSGRGTDTQLWVQDTTGSAASVAGRTVHQYGPRALWREIEQVHAEYVALGTPEHTRFSLSVGPAGQRVLLKDPPRVIEPAPWAQAQG